MGGASYAEVDSRTQGDESEKAAEDPASARAPARIWRRIVDGNSGDRLVSACQLPACDGSQGVGELMQRSVT